PVPPAGAPSPAGGGPSPPPPPPPPPPPRGSAPPPFCGALFRGPQAPPQNPPPLRSRVFFTGFLASLWPPSPPPPSCPPPFFAVVVQVLLHLEGQRLQLVARFDRLAPLLVLGLVLLRVLHHALDLGLREPGRRGDGDVLRLVAGLVLRRHVHDAVGVDVERDF